jgi:predicted porin
MNHPLRSLAPIALAALAAFSGSAAFAQSTVTVYGRVDLSLAQQADAIDNKEVRNGSGSRLGFRGTEDLGDGLKAVFQIEHRFNADEGTQSNATRFWEGKAIVGLEGAFGRVTLGREENPAYTFSQAVADPWGTDTVASNGSIVSGRIGSTRYSNTVNYRFSASGFTVGAQIAEADGNAPSGGVAENKPYSLGAAWASGPFVVGVGFENPADEDDHWATVNGSYNFGMVKVGAFFGTGRNGDDQKQRAYLVSATAPIAQGELRASWGQLKNSTTDVIRDRQLSVGYHYALSKRTTVYADVTRENRDDMADNLKTTGYDIGIKHNF